MGTDRWTELRTTGTSSDLPQPLLLLAPDDCGSDEARARRDRHLCGVIGFSLVQWLSSWPWTEIGIALLLEFAAVPRRPSWRTVRVARAREAPRLGGARPRARRAGARRAGLARARARRRRRGSGGHGPRRARTLCRGSGSPPAATQLSARVPRHGLGRTLLGAGATVVELPVGDPDGGALSAGLQHDQSGLDACAVDDRPRHRSRRTSCTWERCAICSRPDLGIVATFEPVVAAVFAWALLEGTVAVQIAGGGVVLAGSVSRTVRPPPPERGTGPLRCSDGGAGSLGLTPRLLRRDGAAETVEQALRPLRRARVRAQADRPQHPRGARPRATRRFVEEEAPAGANVVYSAHGVAPSVSGRAQSRSEWASTSIATVVATTTTALRSHLRGTRCRAAAAGMPQDGNDEIEMVGVQAGRGTAPLAPPTSAGRPVLHRRASAGRCRLRPGQVSGLVDTESEELSRRCGPLRDPSRPGSAKRCLSK